MAGRDYPLDRTRNIGIMAHIDKGTIQIDYYSRQDLDRLYNVIVK